MVKLKITKIVDAITIKIATTILVEIKTVINSTNVVKKVDNNHNLINQLYQHVNSVNYLKFLNIQMV